MKLFRVLFDGQSYFVEAVSMREAIRIWLDSKVAEEDSDYDGTEEPESCDLVHDEGVMRGPLSRSAAKPRIPLSALYSEPIHGNVERFLVRADAVDVYDAVTPPTPPTEERGT